MERSYSIPYCIPSGLVLQFDCLPNGEPIPGVSRDQASSSFKDKHSPDKTLRPAKPPKRTRSRSAPGKFARPASSMTAPVRLPSSDGYGCGLEELSFIRLIPNTNHNKIFEFRKYTFPIDKKLLLKKGQNAYDPMSTQEQIILSTSDEDVFAILETHNVLAGIYLYSKRSIKRAKINMGTSMVTLLEQKEIDETPVGSRRTILFNFREHHINRQMNHILPGN